MTGMKSTVRSGDNGRISKILCFRKLKICKVWPISIKINLTANAISIKNKKIDLFTRLNTEILVF